MYVLNIRIEKKNAGRCTTQKLIRIFIVFTAHLYSYEQVLNVMLTAKASRLSVVSASFISEKILKLWFFL